MPIHVESTETAAPQDAGPIARLRVAAVVAATLVMVVMVDVPPAAARDGVLCLADGRQLSYSDYGDPSGQLVLFFHGTPGSQRDAAMMQARLRTAGVRLVTPSRPGMGLSTHDPGRRIVDWPADVVQLVDAVAGPGEPFAILAMSGGTPYALACVRALPHRVTHVTIASGYAPPEANAPRTAAHQTLDFVERRPRVARLGVRLMSRRVDRRPDAVLDKVAKGWSAGDRQLVQCTPELKREVLATLREATRCGPDGVILDSRLLRACWGFQVAEAVGPPIDIFHGNCDEVAPAAMAHWLHGQLPGSRLTVYPTEGHISTLWNHETEILTTFALRPTPVAVE